LAESTRLSASTPKQRDATGAERVEQAPSPHKLVRAEDVSLKPPPAVVHATTLPSRRKPRCAWFDHSKTPNHTHVDSSNEAPAGSVASSLLAPSAETVRPEVRFITHESKCLSPSDIMQGIVKPAGVSRVLAFLPVGQTETRIACRSWA
ncbi:MAG: hypothetical protein SGPRY_012542, partial [Prymnesium sp.]